MRPPLILSLALIILTCGYGAFQARSLFTGPHITITNPLPHATLTETTLSVEGEVRNATEITVNGVSVVPDTTGHFSVQTLTPVGYGAVMVEAKNRFGGTAHTKVDFFGAPPSRN
jgi:hypothetical protein